MDRAERQARKSERHGANEDETPDRMIASIRSPSAERSGGAAGATLPVVEEAGEAGSTSGRSGGSRAESLRQEKLVEQKPGMSPPQIGAVDGIDENRIDGLGSLEIGAAR